MSVRAESVSNGAAGHDAICLDGMVRPVVHLPSVLEAIQKKVDVVRHVKEGQR
jgi:hypothetical protein